MPSDIQLTAADTSLWKLLWFTHHEYHHSATKRHTFWHTDL